VVLSALERPVHDPAARLHMFCHSLPQRWFQMGVTLAAGGSLRWLRDALGGGSPGLDYAALDVAALAVPPGCDGLLFAPYLTGERTPHDDPEVRGGFLGLSLLHGRGHLVRAVLEGVACSLRDVMELLGPASAAGSPVLLSGGGARGAAWTSIVADVLGRPVERLAVDEGPALGAALLAGLGTGVFPDALSATGQLVRFLPPVSPGPAREVYQDLYPRWRRLYPLLRELR
jgi:xylulokinase